MKRFIILSIALGLSLAGITFSVIRGQQTNVRDETRLKDNSLSLQERIKIAKDIGVNKITLELPRGEYEAVENLDAAIRNSEVISAQPVESFTELVNGASKSTVLTWYKFRIIERITHKIISQCCEVPTVIPKELLPLGENELLIPIVGGSLDIQGITINQNSPLTEYFSLEPVTEQVPHPSALHYRIASNKMYLLFVKPQPSNQFATLHFGHSGVFEISSDENLTPAVSRARHPLIREILSLNSNSNRSLNQNPVSKLGLFRDRVRQQENR
jgi:hypothetical protein